MLRTHRVSNSVCDSFLEDPCCSPVGRMVALGQVQGRALSHEGFLGRKARRALGPRSCLRKRACLGTVCPADSQGMSKSHFLSFSKCPSRNNLEKGQKECLGSQRPASDSPGRVAQPSLPVSQRAVCWTSQGVSVSSVPGLPRRHVGVRRPQRTVVFVTRQVR